jgi:hypothetical protein
MSNPYLQKLRALKTEKSADDELTKLTKPRTEVVADAPPTDGLRFVSFVSTKDRGFSKAGGGAADQGDLAATTENVTRTDRQNCQNPPFWRTLTVLEVGCPDLVSVDRWQQAVEDGRAFLAKWGEQAEALGWTARDLFGLHVPPEKPHPSYSRLSRYDETGLIWLLSGGTAPRGGRSTSGTHRGREVIALTEATATIKNPATGTITTYRRHNKPALGPEGDSMDDFQ